MPCTLLIRGGEIALHHSVSYNFVVQRANKAKAMLIDYQNGNIAAESTEKGQTKTFKPGHLLSFKTDNGTDEGGRISVDIENYIGVLSDEHKDVGAAAANNNDVEEEEVEDEEEEEE